ncbi:MAG: alpha/beta hydrolase [Planctomycetes bacterium]|nr:alpha/beta hydrolase [Planctomycetota bacterium]
MVRGCRGLAAVCVLSLFAGVAPAGERAGLVVVAGGVGGGSPLGLWLKMISPLTSVPHEVRDFVWTTGFGNLVRDVKDTPNLMARADQLVREVMRYKTEHPDCPVYLVGHSGGTGLVLAAAERLPPATLERIVLLSPAVSPGFDLRLALRATRGEVVSFHSPLDRFWLDWGTTRYGTIDRLHTPAAGVKGFVVPAGLDAEGETLYRRLVQIGWKPEMLLEFRGGFHVSTIMPAFLARHVAPWLRSEPRP